MPMSTELVDAGALRAWPLPHGGGSKYERGVVLVAGGAASSPGAAMLAGEAALRVGAGRLTLAVEASVAAQVAVALPECATLELGGAHDEYGRVDAALIGPGLDESSNTRELVDALVPQLDEHAGVVLDAFGLGVLPDSTVASDLAGRLILTPNRQEAELLLGRELDDELDGLGEIADRYGAAVTSFGAIAAPGGRRWRVELHSDHLGTSGSGDVLAGAITGLLARGATPEQAAVWGTYLHHRAGQVAGALGFLARDLVAALPTALAELS